jgi:hypothetical protein
MAVTIDTRPTYFGDRMIVTGSYEAGDTSIDLSGLLVSIDAVIINSASIQTHNISITDDSDNSDTVANVAHVDAAIFSGSTITIGPAEGSGGNTKAGTFLAIGRRS